MDKSSLKALIISKGQQLGLDPQMIEQMLVAKPVASTDPQDIAQLQGTQLGNMQKTLGIQQDITNNPLTTTKNQLDIQSKQQDIQSKSDQIAKDKKTTEDAQKGEDAIYDLLKKGQLEFSQSFAAKYPRIADRYVNEGGKAVTAVSAEDKKASDKIKGVEDSAKVLMDNLKNVKDRGPVAGRAASAISAITGGAAYKEVGAYESLRKSLIGPLARAISGEVGVLTDKDIERADGLLPKVEDDPGLAQKKLENLNALIKSKGGQGFTIPGSTINGKTSGGYKIEEVK